MEQHIIGDYRIVKTVEKGVLGEVVLAEHRFIKKNFLLKILPQELAQNPDFMRLFEEGIAGISTLSHPYIVPIHNVSSDGVRYFLVTECIVDATGEVNNLAQYLMQTAAPLSEQQVYKWSKQMASALDYAHLEKGIAHLALNFSHILIGGKSEESAVFLCDFGLATVIGESRMICQILWEATNLLKGSCVPKNSADQDVCMCSQAFLGGYAFLAPEQKQSKQVGWQADIYAFGVLLYYLLTRQFPEGYFPMPSECFPDSIYNWDDVIRRCLHSDPRRRPTQLLPLFTGDFIKIQQHIETISEEMLTELVVKDIQVALDKEAIHETALRTVVAHKNLGLQTNLAAEFIDNAAVAVMEIAESEVNGNRDGGFVLEEVPVVYPINKEPLVKAYSPEKKDLRYLEPLRTEMVVLQAGEFIRGSLQGHRDEMPMHKISLNSFAIDIHPVTNEQFMRFLQYIGGEKDQNYNDLIRLKDSRICRGGERLFIETGYSQHPVVGVTWYGAFAYAQWVGRRLPSEAEWEIAAYGGAELLLYPTGENINKNQANFFSSDTTVVMKYPPNKHGIYDMAGNVYEWCQDWYGYNYYEFSAQEPNDPKGPLQGVYRVLRGGCWKSLVEDMRCAHRHRNNPGTFNSTYGFRCAADIQTSSLSPLGGFL